eukprot:GHVP01002190.1.p2 GENE.GHVP01002190.1~~GHVP01002190.1.p2  ORF type:complete len:261 (+),score=43.45 GHVP01002190.1:754-1536(+)
MTFSAVLNNGSILRKVIDSAKEFVNEGNIECSENAFELAAMDQAHVTLIQFKLLKSAFEDYQCDKPSRLGVNFVNMAKLLKCGSQDDKISLNKDDKSDRLKICTETAGGNKKSIYDLNLMSLDIDPIDVDISEFDSKITMSSAEFKRICSSMESVGESVSISVTGDQISFETQGDIGNGQIVLKNGVCPENITTSTQIEVSKKTTITALFSLKYLANFSKGNPFSENVSLYVNEESPLVVSYEMPEVGYVKFYLAPKADE